MHKYFTSYFTDGIRVIFRGATLEEGMRNEGFLPEDAKTILWTEDGATESHLWSEPLQKWVKATPMVMPVHFMPDYTNKELELAFNRHLEIKLTYPNKDILTLRKTYGDFYGLGLIVYLELSFGEYHDGEYGQDLMENSVPKEGAHHFMMVATEYFQFANLSKAILALRYRVKNFSNRSTPLSESLTNIAKTSTVFLEAPCPR